MVNRWMAYGEAKDSPAIPAYLLPYELTKQLNKIAIAKGNDEFAPQWAGQDAPLARGLFAAQLIAAFVQRNDAM